MNRCLSTELINLFGKNHLLIISAYVSKSGNLDSVTLFTGYAGDPSTDPTYLEIVQKNMKERLKGKWIPSKKYRLLIIPIIIYDDLDQPQKPYLIPMLPQLDVPKFAPLAAECVFVTPIFVRGHLFAKY